MTETLDRPAAQPAAPILSCRYCQEPQVFVGQYPAHLDDAVARFRCGCPNSRAALAEGAAQHGHQLGGEHAPHTRFPAESLQGIAWIFAATPIAWGLVLWLLLHR